MTSGIKRGQAMWLPDCYFKLTNGESGLRVGEGYPEYRRYDESDADHLF